MTNNIRKSLVAEFDELVRNRSVLSSGNEPEFLSFANNQEVCRKRWYDAEVGLIALKDKVEELKHHNAVLQHENVALETKLKHARSQIDHEIQKRQRAEQELNSAERQIALVRELLSNKNPNMLLDEKDREKLSFLSTNYQNSIFFETSPKRNLPVIEESISILSPSDISYDKTEEDLDVSYLRSGRKWKRPSTNTLDETHPDKRPKVKSKKIHRRSNSADQIPSGEPATLPKQMNSQNDFLQEIRKRRLSSPGRNLQEIMAVSEDEGDHNIAIHRKDSTKTIASSPSIEFPSMRRNNSNNALNRQHVFLPKTCIKPEICLACGKKLRFGKSAMKCKDCRAAAHPECRDSVPLPCVPTLSTPLVTTKNSMGLLSDYTSTEPPMIPRLVIHCVNEIESRGLTELGIYRVPGSEKDVKELKEKFLRGKVIPNLSQVDDVHVICGCLKDFLRGLKEPLVTYQLWNDFAKAAAKTDRCDSLSDTYQAISSLPQPNRDTIAFLILHLQKVAECVECKMPADNLAKVFGPTMIGFSCPEPEANMILSETRLQPLVVERLMSISPDYWNTFINIDNGTAYRRSNFGTPQTPEVPLTMLGPVSLPNDVEQQDKYRWFTPKFGSKSRANTVKQTAFFSSPMLK